jgi:hypothetical protein
MTDTSRMNEWFVPKRGPVKFRAFVGMLFLPYTGMCVSFAVIGSLISSSVLWDRVLAIFLIYFLSVGFSAHAADNLGSRKAKPWSDFFTKKTLIVMTITGVSLAYVIGIYYMIKYVPLLWPIAIAEGFFLFAYNFELFNGLFHNNLWFAISWGCLPVLAGYVMQNNSISELAIVISIIAGILAYMQIRISRKYKVLKRTNMKDITNEYSKRLEDQLKLISLATLSFASLLICITYVLTT